MRQTFRVPRIDVGRRVVAGGPADFLRTARGVGARGTTTFFVMDIRFSCFNIGFGRRKVLEGVEASTSTSSPDLSGVVCGVETAMSQNESDRSWSGKSSIDQFES